MGSLIWLSFFPRWAGTQSSSLFSHYIPRRTGNADTTSWYRAALFGGFVGSFLKDLDPEDVARKEIPLSEVLPQPAGGLDTGLRPQEPPYGIGSYHKFRWAPEINVVVVVPEFEVETAKARTVLPKLFSREDTVCQNLRNQKETKAD